MKGALMVCGTASDAGKSQVVAGLCRVLARRGVRVAPFKGQNMALNSAVTDDGAEIGRAQAAQAVAAGLEAEAAMNPVLLKPTGERTSQVVVMGRPWRTLGALDYQAAKAALVPVVDAALADLRSRHDVVLCEGAGSPAEINLLSDDLTNLGLAARAGVPAVVVGDIDRGGVFAHLYGTVALLPDELRRGVRGFVLNKFRGDPALLGDALDSLEARCGVPTLGVLPWLEGVSLDAEDSLALARFGAGRPFGGSGSGSVGTPGAVLDVAVVRFPRISNFTDLDPLWIEVGVSLRLVEHPAALGRPDVVILPGTKSTAADLEWCRASGLAGAIEALVSAESITVLGICGGYQMLGQVIEDPDGVESPLAMTPGLGWLDVATRFEEEKVTRRRGAAGYQIHHGRVIPGSVTPWFSLDGDSPEGEPEGAVSAAGSVYGTTLHGLFENDELRGRWLAEAAARRGRDWQPSGVSFAAAREAQLDRWADACEAHLDLDALWSIISSATG